MPHLSVAFFVPSIAIRRHAVGPDAARISAALMVAIATPCSVPMAATAAKNERDRFAYPRGGAVVPR